MEEKSKEVSTAKNKAPKQDRQQNGVQSGTRIISLQDQLRKLRLLPS